MSRVDLNYVVRTARTALAVLAEGAGLDPAPLPTLTPTRTATATRTGEAPPPSATPTPTVASCAELAANGGFEANAAWTFGATGNPGGYTATQARSGLRSRAWAWRQRRPRGGRGRRSSPARSIRLRTKPAGRAGAVGRQLLHRLPDDHDPCRRRAATLTFWHRPGTQAASGDFQRVLLLKPGSYGLIATVMKTLAGADTWQPVTFDLTPYRGQSIVVYFEVYNDDTASGPRTWMFVDDVSAQSCSGAAPTSSPTAAPTGTATPTPVHTPTATPSRTPTLTLIASATATPTASPSATATPSPTSAPATLTATATATATPSFPPTPTPTPTATSIACVERVANGSFEAAGG